tara:strand:- start:1041 stop:1412 length:372 start_codon:yes stop_codon:yes gene_type:complete
MLLLAAGLTLCVGMYHSVAGEIRVIRPLLASSALPLLGPGLWYTRALIRTAWHLTTLTWFGVAAIMVIIQNAPAPEHRSILWTIAGVFTASGLAALILSRGRHPAWMGFLPVAALAGMAASQL